MTQHETHSRIVILCDRGFLIILKFINMGRGENSEFVSENLYIQYINYLYQKI